MNKGYFGEFGGRYVPELPIPPLDELERAMEEILPAPAFQEELCLLYTSQNHQQRQEQHRRDVFHQ